MGKCVDKGYIPYVEINMCSDCIHKDVCGDKDYLTENRCSDKIQGNVKHIAALVKAWNEERAVVLPCKPSDVTVYQLRNKKHARGVGISPRHISSATVWADGNYSLSHQGADDCLKKDLGKTWFLTYEEAEAALREANTNAPTAGPKWMEAR